MTCPDCIIEMKKETRPTKRGDRVFMVCPKCGYNEQANGQLYQQRHELSEFETMKNLHNNNELINEYENE
jgi:hypothetical protein